MKKLLAIFLSMVLLFTTACATTQEPTVTEEESQVVSTGEQEETTPEYSGELTFMAVSSVSGFEGFEEAIANFEEMYPGVTVSIESLEGAAIISKFTTTALAGAGPDVVTFDVGKATDISSMGLLMPLTDKLAEIEGTYFEGAIDAGMFQGEYYTVPWYFNNLAMYYNQDILDEIEEDIPTNWEELEEVVRKATEAGYSGITTRLNGYSMFHYFFQAGNPVIDTTGEVPVVTVNDESGQKAFDFYTGLHTKYNAFPESMKEATSWDKAYVPFVQGESALLISGDFAYSHVVELAPDLNFGIAPLPEGDIAASTMGGYSMGINVNSEQKELAWEFVQYITGEQFDDVLFSDSRMPARTEVDYSTILEINPSYGTFIDQAPITVARPRVVNAASVDEMLANAFKKVLFDLNTAEEALTELEAELNAFVQENYLE